MASRFREVLRRAPFGVSRRTSADVAAIREIALHLQQLVEAMNHTVVALASTVERLNHDVRAGSDESLPLFLGYAERLRLDTDTSIAAAQLIERQIAELRALVADLRVEPDRA